MSTSQTPPLTEIYIDGASSGNPGPSGSGVVVLHQGKPSVTVSVYLGETTNNVAEYMALLYALQEAQARGIRCVAIRSDSELLVKQFHGEYQVRDQTLRVLRDFARYMARQFQALTLEHIDRRRNAAADRLATQAIAARFETSVQVRTT